MSTRGDRAVLNAIFNPLMPLDDETENISQEEITGTASVDDECDNVQSRELEEKGVELANCGKLDESVVTFTDAITVHPTSASAHNNRAQAYRLLGNIEKAMEDLDKAVELSQGRGKAACQAYTQRAMIYRLRGSDDEARADFEKAVQLGSSFAKSQLVAMNPYAAMCNKMLADMIGRLQRGEAEDTPDCHPPA